LGRFPPIGIVESLGSLSFYASNFLLSFIKFN
jgi:hypothetical protein